MDFTNRIIKHDTVKLWDHLPWRELTQIAS